MWRIIKENWRMIALTLLALLAGMVIGFFIGFNASAREERLQAAGRLGEASVLPETVMERQVYYTRCRHCTREQVDQSAFIGYTREELQAFYSGEHISVFSGAQVVIVRTVEGCCPEHVILRLEGDGDLSVYRTDAVSYEERLIHTVDAFETAPLPEEERKALAEGLLFDSFSQIDAYLEGMES